MSKPHLTTVVRFIVVVACGTSFVGCGTYKQAVFMLPQASAEWKKPGWGVADREFQCNGRRIIVNPVLVHARKVADSFFWIPIPSTTKQETKPDISQALSVTMRFGPNFELAKCSKEIVSITGLRTEEKIHAYSVRNESYNTNLGLHFCTYEFIPISKIGDEFHLHFSSKAIHCAVAPLLFRREDSITYFPAFVP